MALPMPIETFPLLTDQDGVVRVGGTRVTLDTVVYAFEDGASPEEIALRYPSLQLADIYSTVSYYLRNRPAVREYLERREAQAREVRRQNEERFDPTGIRERLLARKAG